MATCKPSSQTGLDSWQSRKSLTECLGHSLENKMFTNVTFKVGREQKCVQAHRQILSIRSGVFEAMFYGPLAEQDEIVIPEVEHDIFEQFLSWPVSKFQVMVCLTKRRNDSYNQGLVVPEMDNASLHRMMKIVIGQDYPAVARALAATHYRRHIPLLDVRHYLGSP
ncbi:BTB/POZ domain-containing protein 6-A-like [Gigantopelta aegis]|uniref:BTB/POZ domain-containing protein 6-A-like n=1 Tax=Gigantopelta aegis TaxID=1735272 RepID=UPI001B88BB84|nr:BTB/POZ domain-containing protein 6-A-like [Gigantopelta aegis]